MGQLVFEGGEVERAPSAAPLSPVQREVVRRMRDGDGTIRTSEVGRMVHDYRRTVKRREGYPRPELLVPGGVGCGHGAKNAGLARAPREGAAGCCAYAAPDGLSLMNRLMERGLVERTERRGTWRLVTPS